MAFDPRLILHFVRSLYIENYIEVQTLARMVGNEDLVYREILYAAIVVNDPLCVTKICRLMRPEVIAMFIPMTLRLHRYHCLEVIERFIELTHYDDKFSGFLEWKLAQI